MDRHGEVSLPPKRSLAPALGGLFAVLGTASAGPAAAHVKWFSLDADCAMPPLLPLQVAASSDFLLLGFISLVMMGLAGLIDMRLSRPGSSALAFAQSIDQRVVAQAPAVLRLGLAAFFAIAVWYFHAGPVFLTPELKSTQGWVPTIQLAIALTLLWRPVAWMGALGIGALYLGAVGSYGWFHLLDYPVFLAAAVAVAIDSISGGRRTDWVLAVLRVGAGVTLMWAGAEKWLYPWWSGNVLDHELRALRGGMTADFFMAAAGWVEFCAAYALVFGRLNAQFAAWFLLVPFLAAIPVFGVLDAIGHAPIVVVLLLLGLTRTRLPAAVQGVSDSVRALRRAATCVQAALALVGVYWCLQALAYRRIGEIPSEQFVVVALLVAPIALWGLPRLQRRPHLRTETRGGVSGGLAPWFAAITRGRSRDLAALVDT